VTENLLLARTIADALENSWRAKARADQIAPPGDWSFWLLLGGRGAGKTRSLSEWVLEQKAAGKRRIALLAATASDTRSVLSRGRPASSRPHHHGIVQPSIRRCVV
jgi:phage terminase large subunit-like protein